MAADQFLEALYRVPGLKSELRRRSPCTPTRWTRKRSKNSRGVPRSDHREPRPRAALHHRDGLGLAEQLPARSPSSRAPRARSETAARRLPLPARKPRAGSTSSRSTGSPGRTCRAPATSATRSGSSAKAQVQAEAGLARLRRDQPRPRPTLGLPGAAAAGPVESKAAERQRLVARHRERGGVVAIGLQPADRHGRFGRGVAEPSSPALEPSLVPHPGVVEDARPALRLGCPHRRDRLRPEPPRRQGEEIPVRLLPLERRSPPRRRPPPQSAPGCPSG